ncbi:MAG TPA: hypothetical protein VGK67_09335 [Myxococcales bacterium]|jgi:hypothetical protein
MDDKHAGKGSQKSAQAAQQAPGQRKTNGNGRFGKKGAPRQREMLHHGRLPEGNGATGKPAFFPPHP